MQTTRCSSVMASTRVLVQTEGSMMTTKQAVESVLTGRRKPMPIRQIIEEVLPLADGLKGAAPRQTVYSIVYGEAKREDGLVVQVDRGTFKLNPKRRRSSAKARA
jgi:hypothetical protein